MGYDIQSLTDADIAARYQGDVALDPYGRRVPTGPHGSVTLAYHTFSSRIITHGVLSIFDAVVNPDLLIRRLNVTVGRLVDEQTAERLRPQPEYNLFSDREAMQRRAEAERQALAKERRMMETTLEIKKKFGKNALLKGLNFEEGATARERNAQIGGHKA